MMWVELFRKRQASNIEDWLIHDGYLSPILTSTKRTASLKLGYDSPLDLAILRKRLDQHLGEPITIKTDGRTACQYRDTPSTWAWVVPDKGEYPVFKADDSAVYFTPPGSRHLYRAFRGTFREFYWDDKEAALIHAAD